MDVSRPYSAVCPTLDGEVLQVLAGTTRLLTGREVARLTGRSSHSGVLDVLHRLTEHGLVTRVELNRAFLFALNREHLAAPAVETLMEMRAVLMSRIRSTSEAWEIGPTNLSVFGSAARGDGDTRSDIDVFVVRPRDVDGDNIGWRAQLEDLSSQIMRWTGNHAGIVEVAETEIAQLRTDERPIVAALRADAISLTGCEIDKLLDTA
jgi:predicted nucleotidyltransferase